MFGQDMVEVQRDVRTLRREARSQQHPLLLHVILIREPGCTVSVLVRRVHHAQPALAEALERMMPSGQRRSGPLVLSPSAAVGAALVLTRFLFKRCAGSVAPVQQLGCERTVGRRT